MYLYNRSGVGFSWGHLSSEDLVHWRHHPDAIGPGDGDEGCFSGGVFVDDDATAYLTYWMLWDDKGIGIAKSSDRRYDHWQKLEANPVIKSTEWGITETADRPAETDLRFCRPDQHLEEGRQVLHPDRQPAGVEQVWPQARFAGTHERGSAVPARIQPQQLAVRGDFYQRNPQWTETRVKTMCPSFSAAAQQSRRRPAERQAPAAVYQPQQGLPVLRRRLRHKNDRFIPNNHGRMTWVDNTYFAPEALIDGKGRQIMWAWLTDNPGGEEAKGWSGCTACPDRSGWAKTARCGWDPSKNSRRCDATKRRGTPSRLATAKPRHWTASSAIAVNWKSPSTQRPQAYGVKVRASSSGEEETLLYYDAASRTYYDSTRSGIDGRAEPWNKHRWR